MHQVLVKSGRILVDDKPVELISGEFHYWRNDPDHWEGILERIQGLGLKSISSYVPWQYHALQTGSYDFTGETKRSRNLVRFLELVAQAGLWLLIRPGPYIYAEWKNAGVPDWVYPYHRLHPEFMKLTQDYVSAVCEVLRPQLATHGGRIVALQADNNIECWDQIYEKQLGLTGGQGPFQTYLQDKYKDVSALNRAWKTQYREFGEAQGYAWSISESKHGRRRYLDMLNFRWWYTNQYARWIKQTYIDVGIDIPIYFNGFISFNKEQNLADLGEIGAFAGPNIYPHNEFGTHDELQVTLQDLRYVQVYSAIPYITELQAGDSHGLHYPRGVHGPKHYRLTCLAAILAGITSWSWFMLVGRDEWYGSPIDSIGNRPLELYQAFQQLTALAHTLDLPNLRKLAASSIVIRAVQMSDEVSTRCDAVYSAFYRTGVDYELFDPKSGVIIKSLMFYGGSTWLPAGDQKRLRDYVEHGGTLVFFQTHPVEDENLEDCNLLGIAEPVHSLTRMFVAHFDTDILVRLGDTQVRVVAPQRLDIYSTDTGIPLYGKRVRTTAFEDSSGEWASNMMEMSSQDELCVGYVQTLGKGKLVVLGVEPNADLVIALHNYLGFPAMARAAVAGIQTAIFEGPGYHIVVLINNGVEEKETRVEFAPGIFGSGPYRVEELISGVEQMRNLNRELLIVKVPGKDGVVLRITSTQGE